jgi:4-diphosphocytidyl-2-C-methyl-D-erythritol kinase
MRGIGQVLDPVAALPECALVLVRPPVAVPTGGVFNGLSTKNGSPMTQIPKAMDVQTFAAWLHQQRNDLQQPAIALAPQVAEAIDRLHSLPDVIFAGMSGSGATCFGLVQDIRAARQVAELMKIAQPHWWVAAAGML